MQAQGLNRNTMASIPECRRYPWLWNSTRTKSRCLEYSSPIEEGVIAQDIITICNDYGYVLTDLDRDLISRTLTLEELSKLFSSNIEPRLCLMSLSMNPNMAHSFLQELWTKPLDLNDRSVEHDIININMIAQNTHVDELLKHKLRYPKTLLCLNESVTLEHSQELGLTPDTKGFHNLLGRGDLKRCIDVFTLSGRTTDPEWILGICSHRMMTSDIYLTIRKMALNSGLDTEDIDDLIHSTMNISELVKLKNIISLDVTRISLRYLEYSDLAHIFKVWPHIPKMIMVSSLHKLNIMDIPDSIMSKEGWCEAIFSGNIYHSFRFPHARRRTRPSAPIRSNALKGHINQLNRSLINWNDVVSSPDLTDDLLTWIHGFHKIDWCRITSRDLDPEVLWELSGGTVQLSILIACKRLKINNLQKYLSVHRSLEWFKLYTNNLPCQELLKLGSNDIIQGQLFSQGRKITYDLVMKYHTPQISHDFWGYIQRNCIIEDIPKFNRSVTLTDIIRSKSVRVTDLNNLYPTWLKELECNIFLSNILSSTIHPDDRTHPCLSVLPEWPYRSIILELFMDSMTDTEVIQRMRCIRTDHKLSMTMMFKLRNRGCISYAAIASYSWISMKDRYHIGEGFNDLVLRSHVPMDVIHEFYDLEVLVQG